MVALPVSTMTIVQWWIPNFYFLLKAASLSHFVVLFDEITCQVANIEYCNREHHQTMEQLGLQVSPVDVTKGAR